MADTGNSEFNTIIGVDASFKGDLTFDSSAKVLGRIEGSIKSKGKVLLADGSNCKAKISAKEVSIEGAVEGDVEATERVELKPSAKITGDIVAAKMTMSDGASIDGHLRIGADAASSDSRVRSTAETKPAGGKTSADGRDAATTGAAQPAKR